MSLTSQLSDIMGKYRDCPAITDQDGTRTLTYGELDGLSGRAASKLRDLGIREGESVAVNMDRRTEYIAAELAILRIGAVVVPLIPDYPGDRVDYIRKDAGNSSSRRIFSGICRKRRTERILRGGTFRKIRRSSSSIPPVPPENPRASSTGTGRS